METFLVMNSLALLADDEEIVAMVWRLRLISGKLTKSKAGCGKGSGKQTNPANTETGLAFLMMTSALGSAYRDFQRKIGVLFGLIFDENRVIAAFRQFTLPGAAHGTARLARAGAFAGRAAGCGDLAETGETVESLVGHAHLLAGAHPDQIAEIGTADDFALNARAALPFGEFESLRGVLRGPGGGEQSNEK